MTFLFVTNAARLLLWVGGFFLLFVRRTFLNSLGLFEIHLIYELL